MLFCPCSHAARKSRPNSSGQALGRQPFWTMISKCRCRVILRIESIGSDSMQEVDHLLCSGKRSSGVYPKRREVAPTIKRLDSCAVLQAQHVLLDLILD